MRGRNGEWSTPRRFGGGVAGYDLGQLGDRRDGVIRFGLPREWCGIRFAIDDLFARRCVVLWVAGRLVGLDVGLGCAGRRRARSDRSYGRGRPRVRVGTKFRWRFVRRGRGSGRGAQEGRWGSALYGNPAAYSGRSTASRAGVRCWMQISRILKRLIDALAWWSGCSVALLCRPCWIQRSPRRAQGVLAPIIRCVVFWPHPQ